MKKTTRLTALLIALVLLLANISASATETGAFPVEDLNFQNYSTMKTNAEDDPWGLFGHCGDDNVYCVFARKLISLPTAQEQYAYMMDLAKSEEDPVALEFTMFHYYGNEAHRATNAVCVCSFPAFEPENVYVPGDLSKHNAGCPWKYENLTLKEQFDIANEAEDKAVYVNALNGNAEAQKKLVYSMQAGTTEAMYLEGTSLISITTGEPIATYDPATGALTDVSMGLIVGYVHADGTVQATPPAETTGGEPTGDETAN